MAGPDNADVRARAERFLKSRIVPAAIVGDVALNTAFVEPARYNFSGPHAAEYERIARAASAASGIAPDPEQLTGEAMAALRQATERAAGPPGAR